MHGGFVPKRTATRARPLNENLRCLSGEKAYLESMYGPDYLTPKNYFGFISVEEHLSAPVAAASANDADANKEEQPDEIERCTNWGDEQTEQATFRAPDRQPQRLYRHQF